jgi:hypothetical protein
MVDLLALTSLDQLLIILKTIFPFLTKLRTLMRRSTVLIYKSVVNTICLGHFLLTLMSLALPSDQGDMNHILE